MVEHSLEILASAEKATIYILGLLYGLYQANVPSLATGETSYFQSHGAKILEFTKREIFLKKGFLFWSPSKGACP